jgi:predicted site-specific integrase-resolvase
MSKDDHLPPELEELRLLSTRTTARILDTSQSTVRRWIEAGILDKHVINGTAVRTSLESVERLRKSSQR